MDKGKLTEEELIQEIESLRAQITTLTLAEIERKQAEEQLIAAQTYQQLIIDGIADPIMVIDNEYRVKLMNRAACEFSTGDKSSVQPIHCYQISHQRETPCEGVEHPCPLEKVREMRQPVTVLHEHSQANGEKRLFEIIAAPLWEQDGSLQGIVESMRDVTDRKRVEMELQTSAERLRALAAQLTEVSEKERQRLARELHDLVGQNLTTIGINLNIIQSQLPLDVSAPIRSRLEDSLTLIEATTERIRNVMVNLRPPVLDDYGLVAALRWYGEQFAWRTDIAVVVEGEEPEPRLVSRTENALFRIAQEALTNVAKHAHATRVMLKVALEDDTLRLVIADDGVGFVPTPLADTDEGRGWGLLTMHERAESLGGNCRIKSSPGQGTQVIVEVAR